uniref:Uncharacterized protein n=1 Tax=Aegilops tauschii subsp. strangulata TaxID=200361 RepID=A0A452Y757_AEGTS
MVGDTFNDLGIILPDVVLEARSHCLLNLRWSAAARSAPTIYFLRILHRHGDSTKFVHPLPMLVFIQQRINNTRPKQRGVSLNGTYHLPEDSP